MSGVVMYTRCPQAITGPLWTSPPTPWRRGDVRYETVVKVKETLAEMRTRWRYRWI
jgi:hypothetical protein